MATTKWPTKRTPFLNFVMFELIMVLSAVLGKYSDLVGVRAPLVINAVLNFTRGRRVAGVH